MNINLTNQQSQDQKKKKKRYKTKLLFIIKVLFHDNYGQ